MERDARVAAEWTSREQLQGCFGHPAEIVIVSQMLTMKLSFLSWLGREGTWIKLRDALFRNFYEQSLSFILPANLWSNIVPEPAIPWWYRLWVYGIYIGHSSTHPRFRIFRLFTTSRNAQISPGSLTEPSSRLSRYWAARDAYRTKVYFNTDWKLNIRCVNT